MTTCGTGTGNFPQPGDPDLNNSVLSAAPAFGGIDVAWTYPGLNAYAVAHTILYRSTSSDPDTRVRHRTVTGDYFFDKTTTDTPVVYYYWIEIVSVNGTVGELIGPASAQARPTVSQTIEMLSSQINEGLLAQSLKDELNRINMLSSDLQGEQAARLSQYDELQADLASYQNDVDGVATLLGDEVSRLDDADTAQISQINTVRAKTEDNSAAITSESQARADGDSALASSIQTLEASSAQKFYQDTAPDPAVVTLHEGDIWVDTTEPGDGSEPPYTLYQWDGSQWYEQTPDTLAGTFATIEAEKRARTNRDDALSQSITTLESTVGQKSRVYFQANPPAAPNNGDWWIDTDNDNYFQVWNAATGAWENGFEARIAQTMNDIATAQQDALDAMTAAQQAQATADGAIRTYYQANAPTGLNSTTDVGDLWFDTDTDQAYRWNGSSWKLIEDNSIANALAAAETAQATADGKITTFYQNTAPTAEGVGDLWVHTGQGNRLKRWTGSTWTDVQDADIATGLSRNTVFRQATAPTANRVGDMWFDSDDGDKPYQWDGSAWQSINLYTGNQVSAAIEDYNTTRVGYCMVDGSPDSTIGSRSECTAAGGTWLDMHAIAEAVKGVQITDGDGETANVEQRMQAYKDDIGNLNGQYTVKVQTDSMGTQYVGGFGLATQGQTVEAGFDVDRFWVGKLQPDGSITGGKLPLIIEGNEVFINEAVIRQLAFEKLRSADGNLVVDSTTGKIKVDYMDVTNMSVRQAQSDNYSAGVNGWRFSPDGSFQMHSAATGGRIQHVGDRIDVYDENNTLRVRIGRL